MSNPQGWENGSEHKIPFFFFFSPFPLLETGSLCGPSWPGTCYRPGYWTLSLRNLPDSGPLSASLPLPQKCWDLKAGVATMPSSVYNFFKKSLFTKVEKLCCKLQYLFEQQRNSITWSIRASCPTSMLTDLIMQIKSGWGEQTPPTVLSERVHRAKSPGNFFFFFKLIYCCKPTF